MAAPHNRLVVSWWALEQWDSFCLSSEWSSSKVVLLRVRQGEPVSQNRPGQAALAVLLERVSWAAAAMPGCRFGCASCSEAQALCCAQLLAWRGPRNSWPYTEGSLYVRIPCWKCSEVQVSALLTGWSMQVLHQIPVTKHASCQCWDT